MTWNNRPCSLDFLIVNEHEALEVYAGCGLGGGGAAAGASSGVPPGAEAGGAADVDPLDASLAWSSTHRHGYIFVYQYTTNAWCEF